MSNDVASASTLLDSVPTANCPGTQDQQQDEICVVGNYRLDKIIGQGTYGKVRLGIHTHTHEKVAIKIIEKSQIRSPKQISRLQREIRFLKLLHHPHIVRIYDVIETSDFIYIIMEYAVGGELFDYIVANKRVKEKEARSFFRMVLSAVDYCHKNAVIHRDLKPENLLFDDRKCIKIIDFGFGNNFSFDSLLDTFCGSPFYAAPEMILGKKYEGPEVDMWSLGIIMYALLSGHLPFDDDNMKELYKKIASGSYTCPDYLLPNARHLISRLITVDPKKRATLAEVMNHPWVNEGYSGPPPNYLPVRPIITNPEKLSPDIIQRLKIVGYSQPDIIKAFTNGEDQSKPHPIRATYWLLSEMIAREEAKMRRQQQLNATPIPNPNLKLQIGAAKSMPDGLHGGDAEDRSSAFPATSPSSAYKLQHRGDSESTRTNGNSNHLRMNAFQQRVFVSLQSLSSIPPTTVSPLPLEESLVARGPHHQPHPQQPMFHKPTSNYTTTSNISTSLQYSSTPQQQYADTAVRRDSGISASAVKPTPTSPNHRDTKGVGGWLMNVSTTSAKTPQEITLEVTRVLRENGVTFSFDASNVIVCSVHASMLEDHAGKTFASGASYSSSVSAWMSVAAGAGKEASTIEFLIELCKVPRMAMYGIHFKRVSGGVWNYKKVCAKLLAQMTGL